MPFDNLDEAVRSIVHDAVASAPWPIRTVILLEEASVVTSGLTNQQESDVKTHGFSELNYSLAAESFIELSIGSAVPEFLRRRPVSVYEDAAKNGIVQWNGKTRQLMLHTKWVAYDASWRSSIADPSQRSKTLCIPSVALSSALTDDKSSAYGTFSTAEKAVWNILQDWKNDVGHNGMLETEIAYSNILHTGLSRYALDPIRVEVFVAGLPARFTDPNLDLLQLGRSSLEQRLGEIARSEEIPTAAFDVIEGLARMAPYLAASFSPITREKRFDGCKIHPYPSDHPGNWVSAAVKLYQDCQAIVEDGDYSRLPHAVLWCRGGGHGASAWQQPCGQCGPEQGQDLGWSGQLLEALSGLAALGVESFIGIGHASQRVLPAKGLDFGIVETLTPTAAVHAFARRLLPEHLRAAILEYGHGH